MAGTTANLNNAVESIDASNDSIVIVNNLGTIPGGKTLDVTGFTPAVIRSGHIIIEVTATGLLKPMPVNAGNTAYATLPAGHTYKGVLIASILTAKPFAGILIRGDVNKVASPYPVIAAVETALPLIRFTKD